MKIKLRLSILFAATTAVLVGVGGAVFVHAMWIGLDNGVLSGLQARAASIQQDLGSHFLAAPLVNRGTPTDIDEASQILVRRDGRLVDLVRSGARPLLSPSQWVTARHGGVQLYDSAGGPDATLMVWAVPSPADGGAVVVVGSSTETVDAAADRVEEALVFGGPLICLLAGVAAWLIAAAALRPVERMRAQAAAMAGTAARSQLDVPESGGEIAALGRTLNVMIEAVRSASDRQSAFVTAAGHELRTPLANLKLELELAGRPGRSRTELAAAMTSAAEEVERLGRLAEGLLLLAGQDEGRSMILSRPCDLSRVVSEAVLAFAAAAARHDVQLLVRAPEHMEVEADPDRLRQVVDNLVDNALRYAPPTSTIEIHVGEERDEVVLSVSDEGPGFDVEFLPRAFERFSVSSPSRTRATGAGSGLGLAIVQSIVAAHGGTVTAVNRPSGGGQVTARLPQISTRSHRRPGARALAGQAHG